MCSGIKRRAMELSILLVLVLISMLVFSAFFWLQSRISPKEMEVIPGSLGWPVVSESFSFLSAFCSAAGIFSFMKNRQQRYGKVFKTFVLGRFTVFMTGREASKILLTGKDGMFTLKVIGNMIMSLEPAGEEQEKFRSNFKIISSSFASLPFKIPGTAYHNGIKAQGRMYDMLDSIIAGRRSGKSIQQDFLESLIMKHSKAEGGEDQEDELTDKQLKDNILTLLVAGHDTTTAALTWLMKFLEENPAVLEKLRVINETLRRATILPWFSRKAAQDFEIDGYKIKKGWSINLDVVSIHHDPEVFPDPEKFDPSRFDAPVKSFSFLGFGSGPRMCPGINLARLEIRVFIHHLVIRYKWKPLEKDDSVQPTLVRMPRNKYPVIVEPL
ncbi:hypothetical protein POTOM_009738 [Populus tomentosa]|uniref:Uncharacterized protein n=1 Tax=Populus tomentosa TaxID=118781 RepID=A0A8X8DA79_POPTO|nr:hypothetical protein POTOM_009738 [Populus tomentosa]